MTPWYGACSCPVACLQPALSLTQECLPSWKVTHTQAVLTEDFGFFLPVTVRSLATVSFFFAEAFTVTSIQGGDFLLCSLYTARWSCPQSREPYPCSVTFQLEPFPGAHRKERSTLPSVIKCLASLLLKCHFPLAMVGFCQVDNKSRQSWEEGVLTDKMPP